MDAQVWIVYAVESLFMGLNNPDLNFSPEDVAEEIDAMRAFLESGEDSDDISEATMRILMDMIACGEVPYPPAGAVSLRVSYLRGQV